MDSSLLVISLLLCWAQSRASSTNMTTGVTTASTTSANEIMCSQVTENEYEIYYHSAGCHLAVFPHDIQENVTIMDVSWNEMINISSLPNLTNLLVLKVSNNFLESFPELNAVAASLETLWMSSNKISYIDPVYLDALVNLVYLDLSSNELSLFPVVTGPRFLRYLDLGYNGGLNFPDLTHIGGELNQLTLTDCNITEVQETLIAPLTKLEILSLDSNELNHFPNLSEVGDTLEILILGQNRISDVHPGLLDNLTGLTTLQLWSNILTTFPNLTAVGSTLKMLNLAYNDVSDVPVSLLGPMIKLETLLIQGNQLAAFPDLRPRSESLKKVNLSNNPITESNTGMLNFLRGLPNVTYMSLRGLGLYVFPNLCDGSPLTMLTGIELASNPLVCDCRLRWLKVTQLSGVDVLMDDKPCIGGPDHMVNSTWESISPDQLVCTGNNFHSHQTNICRIYYLNGQ